MTAPFVTIAICTYNRCQSLAATLATLAAQQRVDAADYEFLIVDNNSDDATEAVARAFAAPARLRLVGEKHQGVAYARNRALVEAKGEWVVFVDDDMRVDAGFLAAWIAALRADPAAVYGAGRILPDWDDAPPAWHRGERLALIDGALGWFDLGEGVRRLVDDDLTPYAGNMAVRRAFGLELGGFRVELGVRKRTFGRGEETDFCLRARRAGATGLYVGPALCLHHFDPARFRPAALFRYGIASGLAHRAIVDADASGSWLAIVWHFARGGWQLLKGRGDRYRQCLINAGVEAALAARSPFREG